MKTSLLFISVYLFAGIVYSQSNSGPEGFQDAECTSNNETEVDLDENFGKLPVSFRPNLGQWEDKIIYQGSAGSGNVYFLINGLSFAHRKNIEYKSNNNIPFQKHEIMVWNTYFEGSNENTKIHGIDQGIGKTNYLLGNDASKYVTNVPEYAEVIYENLYDNIDLRYYGSGSDLKYDFIIKKNADPRQILMKTEGIQQIEINKNGELEIHTSWGIVKERKPYSYQIIDGKKVEVNVRFCLYGENSYGFQVCEDYDRSIDLIIDPVILEWSTFAGGSSGTGNGNIHDTSLDFPANVYGTGNYNASFPTTAGVYDTTYNGGDDVFVFKLNPSGTAMLWSTYFGGAGNEYGIGIQYNLFSNHIVVTGYTDSSAFPTTMGPAYGGGINDGFVFLLNTTGTGLIFSRFLGGMGDDSGTQIHIHSGSDESFVTGFTNSSDFPYTTIGYDTTYNGGYDAFLTQLNGSGDITYSSFIGGSADDYGNTLTSNSTITRLIIGGTTNSSDFPTTTGSYDETYNGGTDAFLFVFMGTTSLYYSTYLGGTSNDYGMAAHINFSDQIALMGYTNSSTFPTTTGVFDETYNGGYDVFVTKMNEPGTTPLYSTFVGGSLDDYGEGMTFNTVSEIFVSGTTNSTDYPVTCNAFQSVNNGGLSDNFVFKLNDSGTDLFYSSYFGGSARDYNSSIATNQGLWGGGCSEGVIISWNSHSSDYPTIAGAHQPTKLNEATPGLFPQPGLFRLKSTQPVSSYSYTHIPCDLTFNFTDVTPCTERTFNGPFTSWSWNFGDGSPGSTLQNPIHTYSVAGTYTVTLTMNPCNATSTQTVIICDPLPVELLSFTSECMNDNGAIKVNWSSASETNNDYYSIERSTDMINFETVGTIKGAGNSNTTLNYSFVDELTYSNNKSISVSTLYYRLKQTDFDGRYKYWGPWSVESCTDFNVFPNPADNEVFIQLSSSNESEAIIEAYDCMGRLVLNKTMPVLKGNNRLMLDVSTLASGAYMLNVKADRLEMAQKIVKK